MNTQHDLAVAYRALGSIDLDGVADLRIRIVDALVADVLTVAPAAAPVAPARRTVADVVAEFAAVETAKSTRTRKPRTARKPAATRTPKVWTDEQKAARAAKRAAYRQARREARKAPAPEPRTVLPASKETIAQAQAEFIAAKTSRRNGRTTPPVPTVIASA